VGEGGEGTANTPLERPNGVEVLSCDSAGVIEGDPREMVEEADDVGSAILTGDAIGRMSVSILDHAGHGKLGLGSLEVQERLGLKICDSRVFEGPGDLEDVLPAVGRRDECVLVTLTYERLEFPVNVEEVHRRTLQDGSIEAGWIEPEI